jgi:hypothetical protein
MRVSAALCAIVVIALGAAAAGSSSTSSSLPPLRTGVFAPQLYGDPTSPDFPIAMAQTKATGASIARLIVRWGGVARVQPKSSAQARNPDYGGYDWKTIDAEVQNAVQHGLSPILDLLTAPTWAMTGNPAEPDDTMLADFTTALATRYNGATDGLPRVSYFMFWNEPNLPQYVTPVTVAVTWYRGALNAFTQAVHAVHPDNLSIGGALAPFGHGDTGADRPPMHFISDLLCVSLSATPAPTCDTKVYADVWSFHPYTEGGPTHKAAFSDDLSLGDIPRAQAMVRAAQKAGHLVASGPVQWWVTEFSWDTNPPDPKALPIAIQARWTSEVLYRLWSDGVSVVTWFQLMDQPYPSQDFQSGLYFNATTLAAAKPKPTLTAFRFPFVAIQAKGKYTLWGRTPTSSGANVTVELKSGSKWKKVTTIRAAADGIFQKVWKTPLKNGDVRARIGKVVSLPFGLKPVPDRKTTPFGIS